MVDRYNTGQDVGLLEAEDVQGLAIPLVHRRLLEAVRQAQVRSPRLSARNQAVNSRVVPRTTLLCTAGRAGEFG